MKRVKKMDYLSRIKFTEEEMRSFRESQDKESKELSERKDFLIGWLVGELIWATAMPTLSIAPITSGNVIKVDISDEDFIAYEKSNKAVTNCCYRKDYEDYKCTDEFKVIWKEYISCSKKLSAKYLPKSFSYSIHIPIKDCPDFRIGLLRYLWDCDGCTYSTEDEDIIIETYNFYTKISFLKID